MEIGGYAIYDLFGFQMHFSVKDILSILEEEKQSLLLAFIIRICSEEELDEKQMEIVLRLQDALRVLCGEESFLLGSEAAKEWTENGEKENRAFFQQFLERNPEQKQNPNLFCHIIFLILLITKYCISPEDAEGLNAFLSSRLDKNILKIRHDESGNPWLCLGKRKIAPLEKPPKALSHLNLVTISRDCDTGFLGIRRDGTIENGSALFLKPLPRKAAVKVALRQSGYAILFQDGTISHNLHPEWRGERISAPVENIELREDRLCVWPLGQKGTVS